MPRTLPAAAFDKTTQPQWRFSLIGVSNADYRIVEPVFSNTTARVIIRENGLAAYGLINGDAVTGGEIKLRYSSTAAFVTQFYGIFGVVEFANGECRAQMFRDTLRLYPHERVTPEFGYVGMMDDGATIVTPAGTFRLRTRGGAGRG